MSDNQDNRKFESVVHAKNVGPEERAKFNERVTLDELEAGLKAGHASPYLLSLRDRPDDNVVFEWFQKAPEDNWS